MFFCVLLNGHEKPVNMLQDSQGKFRLPGLPSQLHESVNTFEVTYVYKGFVESVLTPAEATC